MKCGPLRRTLLRRLAISGAAIVLLQACGGGGSTQRPDAGSSTPTQNTPPTIRGTPATSVIVGQAYSFVPQASDPDSQTLTFDVQNAPPWSSFDPATGRLWGTPTAAHIGVTSGIVIGVSDGASRVTLAPFSIEVRPQPLGSAQLRWAPPTQYENGSPLTISGYKVHYGPRRDYLSSTVLLNSPTATSHTVSQLRPGTYFFAVSVFDQHGTESRLSETVSKIIN